jgi:sporulation protein YlmC with PRC-barrel domain
MRAAPLWVKRRVPASSIVDQEEGIMRVTWRSFALAFAMALCYSATYAQQATPPAAAPGDRGVEIASDSLVGAKVRNPDGREIGTVKHLMVDPGQGRVNSIAIAIGGMMGMGEKTVLVPWQGVAVARDGQRLVLTVRDAVLDQAPSASPPSPPPPPQGTQPSR